MINYCNEIFDAVATDLRGLFEGIRVVGEYESMPTSFPTVTLDETVNVPAHLDSAAYNKYARVQYRAQVFSNLESGKRAQARQIYSALDTKMQELGLFCTTYTTTPAIYNSEIYCITATYDCVIREDGVVYRG